MAEDKNIRRELVNLSGYKYTSWYNEVKDLLAKLYGLDIAEVQNFNPQRLWELDVQIGQATKIAVGSLPDPTLTDEENFFVDDFADWEVSQITPGICI